MAEETINLVLRLPVETHRRLRLMAADRFISMNDLMITLIEKEYDPNVLVIPEKSVEPELDAPNPQTVKRRPPKKRRLIVRNPDSQNPERSE